MAYSFEKAVAKGNPRAVAKSLGYDKYLPDKPCPKGHLTLRYTKYGQCLDCLKIFKADYRSSGRSKQTETAYQKKYGAQNRQKMRLNLYKLSEKEYMDLIWRQSGKCAICKSVLDMGKKTCIDHCHNSKKIRGILCWSCNVGLGHFKDNPELLNQAAIYCEEE